ncbi:MAG: holo-ACP synthase [Anaerolineae bacterium]|nr:holo-ACP synthase [Anaerolineae bacterium]
MANPAFDPVSLAVGVDVIEIERIAHVIERWGARFLQRVYTPDEIARCRGRVSSLAARFAAKEAVGKALGVGVGWGGGLRWTEIEVRNNRLGKPEVILHGDAQRLAEKLGLNVWSISLSHSRENAVAMVVAMAVDRG